MPEDDVTKMRRGTLEALYEFLEGPEEDVGAAPLERILKELQKDKLDPAPLVQMVRERLSAARSAETLARAREQRARMDKLHATRPKVSSAGNLRYRVREALEGLSTPNRELAAAYYRKFEEANDADLASLLEDLDLLDQMSQEDDD